MSDRPMKILLVEDNPGDAHLVKEMLGEATTVQFELQHVERLSKALESLAAGNFDIVLLDLSLPDGSELDTVVQTRLVSPGVPIVIMSGLGDEELAIRAVQEGAQDYLVKGHVDSNLLVRSMRYAIERKRAEELIRRANEELENRVQERTAELAKTNRALMMLNQCNQMMVHSSSESDLLQEMCRIVVDIGGYHMAWIGFLAPYEKKAVRPVAKAHYGADMDSLGMKRLSEAGHGLFDSALRTGTPVIVRNIFSNSDFASWQAEASRLGYASSITIPLLDEGQTGGVLNIHASEPDAFDADEVKLLTELAGDVSYAITSLRVRKERRRMVRNLREMVAALQESERKYRMLIEQASDGIFILDRHGNIIDVNPMACQMLGFDREELLAINMKELIPGKDLTVVPFRINEVLAGEKVVIERRLRHKGGIFINVEISAKALEDGRVQTIARDITERKRSEELLRKSEASLAMAQRIARLGNWELDLQKNVLYWSDEIYRIFGLLPQQFGATYEAFLNSVHPDDREFVNKAVKEALYGMPYSIDHRIVLPDNTVRIVHEEGEVTFGESGEPVRMFGTVQDITERKEAEERLKDSEERYRRMVSAITAYTYSVEVREKQAVSTRHTMGCLPVTGYNPEDYESDPSLWYSMIFPDDRASVETAIKEILAGHEVNPVEHRLIRRDGSVVWVRNTIVPHRNEEGQLIRYDGLVEDITERKEAEKALQDSRAKYAAIVEGFDGFIYICSEDYSVQFMNERLIERTGFNAVGRRCHKVFYGQENVCAWCESYEITPDRIIKREIHSPEDDRWYYMVKTRIHNQDGSASKMVMFQDITDKKENEMRLIMSERLAALGQMASGIAHEINNPLATISACAEGLLNRKKKGQFNPELFENYLKIIDEEVARCKSITTSMLSLVRKTAYEKKNIDVNLVLDKTLELIGFQGRLKKVKVIKNYGEIPPINGSEGEMKQVFLAIIVNALDSIEERGTLTLETGVISSNPSFPLRSGFALPGSHSGGFAGENESPQTAGAIEKGEGEVVFIKIGDTGSGVSSDIINRIFDPFFTTKSEKGGVGLGLSIANKVIRDNNGRIDVTSEEGKGTIFMITLPV